MGNSASKASSGAKTATRHFPSANVIREKAAAAAADSSSAKASAVASRPTTSSPKQDYLEDQRKLEEEIARYDEQIQKSGKLDGESRPSEDTPSAAELQFFGNLRSIGQVRVPNPDQIKHREAEEVLRHKLPAKPTTSPYSPSSVAQSSSVSQLNSSATTSATTTSSYNLTSLKLMELLQLRNHDPSVWTVDRLSEEFGMKREDIQALTKYVNTYTIIPGKDAKGRESGVWCEDLRGVQVLERASAMQKDTKNGGESASAAAASTSASSSSSPSSTTTTISTAMTRNREQAL